MAIQESAFGTLKSGENVICYRLINASGAFADVLNYGGIIARICIPDCHGAIGDVVLGCDDITQYQNDSTFLGALIGRYANRIAGGICPCSGQTLHLYTNPQGHHLHGGESGFNRKLWHVTKNEPANRLALTYVSPDGEEHYPGTLNVSVTYTWNDDNALRIDYHAISDKDTILNLTNHTYFNLAGHAHQDISTHEIRIDADAITEVDESCISTGHFHMIGGTALDLRTSAPIAAGLSQEQDDEQMRYGEGFDHNYVLNTPSLETPSIEVFEPNSGRTLCVYTDQPGVQFYSGNHLKGDTTGKEQARYGFRSGFCLETQHFPDSPNHENFPSTLLKAGESFRSSTIYAFGVR